MVKSNMDSYNNLLGQITNLADEAPYNLAVSIADAIGKISDASYQYDRNRIIASILQPNLRLLVGLLLDTWQRENVEVPSESIALALLSAAQVAERCRKSENVSLVWTGPKTESIPLRRTDQALLQVINEAKEKLLIVSFAVYKIEQVRQALMQAAERGVNTRICIESPDPNQGKSIYNNIQALGEAVAQKAAVYIWPISQRPQDKNGHCGILHVKCAVADENLVFISSANLTEYAFTLNMELGVLIRSSRLAGNVFAHFNRIIEDGVLIPLT